MQNIKELNNQLISLASAIDRLDYAIKTSADNDHLKLWSTIVKWRLEGLALVVLNDSKPINKLRIFQRETLPQIFWAE